MLEPGAVIADFRIERLIGRGGMGAVYEAVQLSLSRTVALKVMAAEYGDDEVFRERFQGEGVKQASLEHPHIVPVYASGEADGQRYLAMRLIRGGNLRTLLADGVTDVDRILALLDQVAGALDAAHAAGYVHRDVKPQNLLIEDGTRAYLADFGLTKGAGERGLTRTGQRIGTLEYTAPEIFRGEEATPASDIYALGAVFYESLAGTSPFPHESDAALMYGHLSEDVPPISVRRADVPPTLDAVFERVLAKDPAARYPTARAFVEAARTAVGQARVEAAAPAEERPRSATALDAAPRRPAAPVPVAAARGKRFGRVALTAVLAAAVMAGAGAALGHAKASPKEVAVAPTKLGRITVTAPTSWKVAAATTQKLLKGVELDGVIRDGAGGEAAFALLQAQPPSYLALKLTGKPKPTAVVAGRFAGYRYVSGGSTIYVFPLASGKVLTAACRALADCDHVVATLAVPTDTAAPVEPNAAFAAAISPVVSGLAAHAPKLRAQLASAKTAAAQAKAATALASLYARAGKTSTRAGTGSFERTLAKRLAQRFEALAAKYRDLAAAARVVDAAAYDRSRTAINAGERAARAEVAALAKYGYST